MDVTNRSLLRRIKNRSDSRSWREFFDLYFPLLIRFARKRGLARADAEDVAQECMRILSNQMRSFDYSRSRGKFKNFLATMVNNAVNNARRKRRPRQVRPGELSQEQQPQDQLHEVWERVWLREHLRYCIKLIKTRFSPETLAAFNLYAVDGQPVERVCEKLGMSANQVYKAKSRVTERLRAEMKRLVGDDL